MFLAVLKKGRELGRLAHQNRQHTSRERIERPQMAHARWLHPPLDLAHDVRRGRPGRLVDKYYSVHTINRPAYPNAGPGLNESTRNALVKSGESRKRGQSRGRLARSSSSTRAAFSSPGSNSKSNCGV